MLIHHVTTVAEHFLRQTFKLDSYSSKSVISYLKWQEKWNQFTFWKVDVNKTEHENVLHIFHSLQLHFLWTYSVCKNLGTAHPLQSIRRFTGDKWRGRLQDASLTFLLSIYSHHSWNSLHMHIWCESVSVSKWTPQVSFII